MVLRVETHLQSKAIKTGHSRKHPCPPDVLFFQGLCIIDVLLHGVTGWTDFLCILKRLGLI